MATECEHMDEFGTITYRKEDDTVTTDKGSTGGVWYVCTQCEQDLTDFLEEMGVFK